MKTSFSFNNKPAMDIYIYDYKHFDDRCGHYTLKYMYYRIKISSDMYTFL